MQPREARKQCYRLCLDVLPTKLHAAICGAFSGEVGSKVCTAGIDGWCNARLKGTEIKGVRTTHPKQPG